MSDFFGLLTDGEWSALAAIAAVAGVLVLILEKYFHLLAWAWRTLTERRPPPPLPPPPPAWPKVVSGKLRLDRGVVGRVEEIRAVAAILADPAAGIPVLKAGGGYGKSTLARAYADQHKGSWYGIAWIDAAAARAEGEGAAGAAQREESPGRQNILASLRELAARTGATADPNLGEVGLALAAMAKIEASGEPWLLVFDNAEGDGAIRHWLPEAGKVRVLVTTRQPGWAAAGFVLCEIDVLPEAEARALLAKESGRDASGPEAGALLEDRLGRLPLAIVLAGAYLRERSEAACSFADYGAELEARIRDRPGADDEYPDSVYGAVMLSVERLSAEARLVAEVCAHWAPEGLGPGLFRALAARPRDHSFYAPVPEDLWALVADAGRLDRAFFELAGCSLLTGEGEGRAMHRLTALVLRGAAPRRREVAAAVLAAGYPSDPTLPQNWEACRRLGPHVAALAAAAPETAAMDFLLHQAGLFLFMQGEHEAALLYLERAREIAGALHGPDSAEVADAWNGLAHILAGLGGAGRLAEAVALAARADEIGAKGAGIPEAGRAVWAGQHGRLLWEIGRTLAGAARAEHFARAGERMAAARDSARARAQAPGAAGQAARREVATACNNLAVLRGDEGKREEALELYAEALRIARAEGDEVAAAQCAKNLGVQMLEAGRLEAGFRGERALALLEAGLAGFEKVHEKKPGHEGRVAAAGWLVRGHLAGAALGLPEASRARAEAVASAYRVHGVKLEEVEGEAADYVARAQAFKEGDAAAVAAMDAARWETRDRDVAAAVPEVLAALGLAGAGPEALAARRGEIEAALKARLGRDITFEGAAPGA